MKTLTRFYLYALINGLQFGWTTWLAFVVARGGNPGWAEGAYHLAILISEVPTGVIADLLGRRKSMMTGLALGALASFSYPLIHDTVTACLVLGLSGFAGTFLSGADSALLYETAEEVGGADFARRAMARVSAIQMAALALAPLIAGWLYEQHPLAPFLSRGVLSLLTIAIVWTMAEKHTPAPTGQRDLWAHTRTAIRYLGTNRLLLALIAFSWLYNLVGAMANQFAQVYLPAIGLTMFGAGMVFSATRLIGSLCGWIAERLSHRTAVSALRFAPLFQGVLYLFMGIARGRSGAVAFVVGDGADGLIYPTLMARLNEEIPSEQRATLLSIQSLGFSLLMTFAFPAAAYLPSIFQIYLATGVVAVIVSLLWIIRFPSADR